MPGWSQMRNSLFSYPKTTAAVVWGSTTFILFFPTLFELLPLGNDKRDSKGDRDDAKDVYDGALAEFNVLNDKIEEDKQRIVDLDCSMAGYQQYNQGIFSFQKNLNDPIKAPMERLNLYWKIYFMADKNENERRVDSKSYYDDVWEYGYFYSCFRYTCGPDSNCCTDWGYHYVTRVFYYNQITNIVNKYQGIILGSPLRLTPLECGYYARRLETLAPVTYVSYESPHEGSGNKRAGTTYIDFYREWSSKINVFFQLDDEKVAVDALVLRTPLQNEAAIDLSAKLYGFLSTAIAAFNMVGANYSVAQDTIRNQLPGLIDAAGEVSSRLQEDEVILNEKNRIYSESNGDYKQGLSVWLPIFFLIPCGLALLTYLFLSQCKERCATGTNDGDSNEAPKDLEANRGMGEGVANPLPSVPHSTYSPAHFQPALIQSYEVQSRNNQQGEVASFNPVHNAVQDPELVPDCVEILDNPPPPYEPPVYSTPYIG